MEVPGAPKLQERDSTIGLDEDDGDAAIMNSCKVIIKGGYNMSISISILPILSQARGSSCRARQTKYLKTNNVDHYHYQIRWIFLT